MGEIKPLSEFIKPDKILASLATIEPLSDKGRRITIEDLQKYVSEAELKKEVPEKIDGIFEAAKMAFVYSYFYYPFFTIAAHYSLLAVEGALKLKHRTEFPKEPIENSILHKIIGNLVKEKIIKEKDKEKYDVSRKLRNMFSHTAKLQLLPPGHYVSNH
ncbi:MAG: hypothetical protein V2A65_04610 [Candidatus Omnitrophota bacterium]